MLLPTKHPLGSRHTGYEGNVPGIPPGGCVLSEAVRKGDAAGLGMFLSNEGYLQEAGLQVCDRQGC